MTTLAALLPVASTFAQQPQAGGDDIRGLHDAITIPTEVVPDHGWIWLTLGGIAVGGLAMLLIRALRSRAAAPSAAEVARQTLATAELEIAQNHNPAQATALLASAVRDYLHDRFDLPTDTRTAAEIARLLQGARDGHALLAKFSGALVRLLHTCEGAVFAREPIAKDEWTEMTTTFSQLIAQREAELANPGKAPVAKNETAEPAARPSSQQFQEVMQ